jgi:hypothetical protein
MTACPKYFRKWIVSPVKKYSALIDMAAKSAGLSFSIRLIGHGIFGSASPEN